MWEYGIKEVPVFILKIVNIYQKAFVNSNINLVNMEIYVNLLNREGVISFIN